VQKHLAVLLLAVGSAHAATTATITPGPWDLYKGSTILKPRVAYPSEAACAAAARLRGVVASYLCKTSSAVDVTVVADPPPPPPPPPPYTGTATLTWAAPGTKADGTTTADVAGYVIRYGLQSGAYTVSKAATSSPATVVGLAPGAWFFVVSAIDSAGNESESSYELSKTVTFTESTAP